MSEVEKTTVGTTAIEQPTLIEQEINKTFQAIEKKKLVDENVKEALKIVNDKKDMKIVNEIIHDKKSDEDDIFITESSLFDIEVKYYKQDGILYVEGIDEEFDTEHPYNKLKVYFKYPSFADITAIYGISNLTMMRENMDAATLMHLEDSRLAILIRKWNLDKQIGELQNLHVKIVKSIKLAVREKIGFDGIL